MPTDFVARPPYNVYQPGAYGAVDASLLGKPNLAVGKPIAAILGVAMGGAPNSPMYFRSTGVLRTVLKSGAAYDAARFAMDGGAPQVCVIRVGNSITQASIALAGSGGTVITLTALDYGSWANAITVAVASGPVITLSYTDQFGNTFGEKWDFTGVGSLTPALIAAAINGTQYGYAASNYVSAVIGAGVLPLSNAAAAALAGGTDGLSPVAGDWTNGLTALETQQVDILVPATSDATVHAQVLAHCQNMSTPAARRERVAQFGGALGESVASTITRIGNLRSARAQLSYPGMQDYNAQGQQTLYDPFYLAAKVAGMRCAANDVATSLVHAQVPIIKAEVDLSTAPGGSIDQLLQAGVSPVAPASGSGYWIVDDITGYNLPDQTWHDMIKTRSADFVNQWVRAELERQYIGSKNLASSSQSIQQAAAIELTKLTFMQVIRAANAPVVEPGPLIGSWAVGLPVMLIDTNKFIFLTVQLQPSSTVQSSTTSTDALA